MELGPLITLAVIYGIMSVIGKITEAAGKGGEGKPGARQRPGRRTVRRPPEVPGGDVRRPKPATFDDLLAEMRAEMERAAGIDPPVSDPSGPPGPVIGTARLPQHVDEEEEIEDRRSSEIEPVVVSMETIPERVPVEVVSLDEQSQRIAEARRREALERSRGWRMRDHQEFHEIIDRPADRRRPGRAPRATGNELRRAMIWREVLDRPVALRDGRSD